MLVLPQGALGEGTIKKVVQPRSFGRDARIDVDFTHVYALDGTKVPVYIGGADCPETVALIKSQIEAANLGIQDIRCVKIGCLIGTYVGPELTLVAWKRK